MGFYFWPFIGPYIIWNVIIVAILSAVGLIVGRLSHHEPDDDV